jgi:hypothetical protein
MLIHSPERLVFYSHQYGLTAIPAAGETRPEVRESDRLKLSLQSRSKERSFDSDPRLLPQARPTVDLGPVFARIVAQDDVLEWEEARDFAELAWGNQFASLQERMARHTARRLSTHERRSYGQKATFQLA